MKKNFNKKMDEKKRLLKIADKHSTRKYKTIFLNANAVYPKRLINALKKLKKDYNLYGSIFMDFIIN